MNSCLCPELRGSQRFLKSLQKSIHISRHRYIRSFSSFQRLQQQPKPDSSTPKPPSQPKSSYDNFPNLIALPFSEAIKFNPKYVARQATEANYCCSPNDLSEEARLDKQHEELKEIESYLEQGEIPPGFVKINESKDLPENVQSWLEGKSNVQLPILFRDDPDKLLQTCPTPEVYQNALNEARNFTINVPETPNQESISTTNFYGSSGARRMRARANKVQGQTSRPLPSWFLDHNILPPESSPGTEPEVQIVQRQNNGDYIPVEEHRSQRGDDNTAPQSGNEIGAKDNTHAHSTLTTDKNQPAQAPEVDLSSLSSKNGSLDTSSYFIEDAQYQELWSMINGRLHSTPETTPRGTKHPVAISHLTINHVAHNTEGFFEALMKDLAKSCDALCVRIDAQDISALMAEGDMDSTVAERGSRLSFRVYAEVYDEAQSPSEIAAIEDDEDFELGDDEDNGPGMGSNIPTVHIPIMAGDISKAMARLQNHFSSPAHEAITRILSPEDNKSRDVPGNFASIIDALLSIKRRQVSLDNGPRSDDQSASVPEQPMIIHVQNYKAILEDGLAAVFLHELCHQAERRAASGQKVMVVGTDSMRDYQVSKNAEAILEEQERKPFEYSNDIVITPVFPTKDAEMALKRDKQRRIQTINLRHLWLVLRSMNINIKELPTGFWKDKTFSGISDADKEAASRKIWQFIYTQRVAGFIVGAHGAQIPRSISEAVKLLSESDESKVAWAQRNLPDVAKDETSEQERHDQRRLAKIRAKATKHEKKLLNGVVEPKKIATTFNDIHIPADTADALQTLTAMSLIRPEAFRYGVLKSDRIPGLLLYGPPGTGKTLAAKAVAKESGATMLEVSAADLNDMYVGEGEKNVQALFSLAKKLSPCVVFLDEADAMFSARANSGRRVSHRELLNQFLREWDGMSNDAGSAFIMVATNRPMDLDDAVLRRLPRRILVDLPTENDRLEILKIHLRHEQLAKDVDLAKLASRTPFYSGSDLKNVAVAAALNCVREENETAKLHTGTEPYVYPEKRTLHPHHFDKALEEISASISEDMSSLKAIKKFDEQFGDRKGRKGKTPKWGFRGSAESNSTLDTVKVRS